MDVAGREDAEDDHERREDKLVDGRDDEVDVELAVAVPHPLVEGEDHQHGDEDVEDPLPDPRHVEPEERLEPPGHEDLDEHDVPAHDSIKHENISCILNLMWTSLDYMK